MTDLKCIVNVEPPRLLDISIAASTDMRRAFSGGIAYPNLPNKPAARKVRQAFDELAVVTLGSIG